MSNQVTLTEGEVKVILLIFSEAAWGLDEGAARAAQNLSEFARLVDDGDERMILSVLKKLGVK